MAWLRSQVSMIARQVSKEALEVIVTDSNP